MSPPPAALQTLQHPEPHVQEAPPLPPLYTRTPPSPPPHSLPATQTPSLLPAPALTVPSLTHGTNVPGHLARPGPFSCCWGHSSGLNRRPALIWTYVLEVGLWRKGRQEGSQDVRRGAIPNTMVREDLPEEVASEQGLGEPEEGEIQAAAIETVLPRDCVGSDGIGRRVPSRKGFRGCFSLKYGERYCMCLC